MKAKYVKMFYPSIDKEASFSVKSRLASLQDRYLIKEAKLFKTTKFFNSGKYLKTPKDLAQVGGKSGTKVKAPEAMRVNNPVAPINQTPTPPTVMGSQGNAGVITSQQLPAVNKVPLQAPPPSIQPNTPFRPPPMSGKIPGT